MAWIQVAGEGVKALERDSAKPFGVDGGSASARGSGLDGSGWNINFGAGTQNIKQSQNKADAGDPTTTTSGGGLPWWVLAVAGAGVIGFVLWKRKKKAA